MRLGYIILYVPDVEAAVGFYERAFGLERRFVAGRDYGEVETGATALAFAAEHMADGNGVDIRPARAADMQAAAAEVVFVTDDPAAAYNRAVKAGAVGVKPALQKPWGQRSPMSATSTGFWSSSARPLSHSRSPFDVESGETAASRYFPRTNPKDAARRCPRSASPS